MAGTATVVEPPRLESLDVVSAGRGVAVDGLPVPPVLVAVTAARALLDAVVPNANPSTSAAPLGVPRPAVTVDDRKEPLERLATLWKSLAGRAKSVGKVCEGPSSVPRPARARPSSAMARIAVQAGAPRLVPPT